MKSFEEKLNEEKSGIDPVEGKKDNTEKNCRNCMKTCVFSSGIVEFEIYKKMISRKVSKTYAKRYLKIVRSFVLLQSLSSEAYIMRIRLGRYYDNIKCTVWNTPETISNVANQLYGTIVLKKPLNNLTKVVMSFFLL